MDGLCACADLFSQRQRGFGAYSVFDEDSFNVLLLAEFCQLRQTLRARLTAGENVLDAALRQAEVTAQISKGGMAGDEVLLRQLGEFALVFSEQLCELLIIALGVLLVEVLVLGVDSGQGVRNIF